MEDYIDNFGSFEAEVCRHIHEDLDLDEETADTLCELITNDYQDKLRDLYDNEVSPEEAAEELCNDSEIQNEIVLDDNINIEDNNE